MPKIQLDPLAVLAILHNPRAVASAVRLFNPPHPDIYRWPAFLLVGSALIPFKVLVTHFVSGQGAIHPTVALCQADDMHLQVVNDLPGGFIEFPVSRSNFWLDKILRYKSSTLAQNDIVVVYVDNILGAKKPGARRLPVHNIMFAAFIRLTASAQMLIILTVAISGFTDNLSGSRGGNKVWGSVLYLACAAYWLSQEAISLSSLVSRLPAVVEEDATRRHAVHTRPQGGKIIFTGRQDVLERWARSQLRYNRSIAGVFAYWFWLLSGSIACVASVICFANTSSTYQGWFLALLGYTSGLEICTTFVAYAYGEGRIHHGHVSKTIGNNTTWTSAIIRARYTLSARFALENVDWIALNQLPTEPIFRNLNTLLHNHRRETEILAARKGELVDFLMFGQDGKEVANELRRPLAYRLAGELKSVLGKGKLLPGTRREGEDSSSGSVQIDQPSADSAKAILQSGADGDVGVRPQREVV